MLENDVPPLTVGRLKEALNLYPDETEINFGGTVCGVPLEFYRVKTRGPHLVQIELNERFPRPGTYSVTMPEDHGPLEIEFPPLADK